MSEENWNSQINNGQVFPLTDEHRRFCFKLFLLKIVKVVDNIAKSILLITCGKSLLHCTAVCTVSIVNCCFRLLIYQIDKGGSQSGCVSLSCWNIEKLTWNYVVNLYNKRLAMRGVRQMQFRVIIEFLWWQMYSQNQNSKWYSFIRLNCITHCQPWTWLLPFLRFRWCWF